MIAADLSHAQCVALPIECPKEQYNTEEKEANNNPFAIMGKIKSELDNLERHNITDEIDFRILVK